MGNGKLRCHHGAGSHAGLATAAAVAVLLACYGRPAWAQNASPSPPPPAPVNQGPGFFLSRSSFGPSLPLEGAIVGGVVGGTVLIILLWFTYRYCCLYSRQQHILTPMVGLEMTATQRHELLQRRIHRQLAREAAEAEAGGQGAGRAGAGVGVPKEVVDSFPVTEFKAGSRLALSGRGSKSGAGSLQQSWRWRMSLLGSSPSPGQTPAQNPGRTSGAGQAVNPLALMDLPAGPPALVSPPGPGNVQGTGPVNGAGAGAGAGAPNISKPLGTAHSAFGGLFHQTPAGGDVEEGSAEVPCCPICLASYKDGVKLRRLPCEHEFHQPCIDSWMMQHRTCPLCRYTLYCDDDCELDHPAPVPATIPARVSSSGPPVLSPEAVQTAGARRDSPDLCPPAARGLQGGDDAVT